MPAIVLHISVTDLIGILPDAHKCKVPLIKVKFDNYYIFVNKPFIDSILICAYSEPKIDIVNLQF